MTYRRLPGASWLRFTPERLQCRNCGAQIRRTILPVGLVALTAMIGLLLVAALVTFPGNLERFRNQAVLTSLLLCVPLSLVVAVWGTGYRLADDSNTLSSKRWTGRAG